MIQNDPAEMLLGAMSDSGIDMSKPLNVRFACCAEDAETAYAIVRATREVGFAAGIEVFDDDHNFDPRYVAPRDDLKTVPQTSSATSPPVDITSLDQFMSMQGFEAIDPEAEDEEDDLIWISFERRMVPDSDVLEEVEEIWNIVLARYGTECDGWEISSNEMVPLQHA